MKKVEYQIEFAEHQGKFYVVDNRGNLYGMLTGFSSEKDALNWIECDRVAPRLKCKGCKRIWVGVKTCPICAETDQVLARMAQLVR